MITRNLCNQKTSESSLDAFGFWLITTLLVAFMLAGSAAVSHAQDPGAVDQQVAEKGQQPVKHALLVGCTKYPGLEKWFQLQGPANDVVLMRQLLVERFGYDRDRDDIVVLAEAESDTNKPTRANIAREFQRLANTVQPGEKVVILLGGHGSKQPDSDAENQMDHEPDGFDEIFLPSDVKGWDGDASTVENAIVDDELGSWLKKIVAKGAFVWLIMDACHSGSGIRGSEAEKSRQIPASQLVPQQVLNAAARKKSGADTYAETSIFSTQGPGGLVAIYAAQSHETTPERRMPIDTDGDKQRKYYGLLTYTICEILTNAGRGITYKELVQAVQARYIAMGRRAPTPLLEGTHRDNLILGQKSFPGRSQILLERRAAELFVSAGSLHGLTKGTVLAVYPAVGSKPADDTRPVGHVRVLSVNLRNARVAACDFSGVKTNHNLPEGGRCQVAYQDTGDNQLRVAVDTHDEDQKPIDSALHKRLLSDMKAACEAARVIQLTNDPASADWVLRWVAGEIQLTPSAGIASSDVASHKTAIQPLRLSTGWASRAVEMLQRINRARNLLRLTSITSRSMEGGTLGLQMSVIDTQGKSIDWQAAGLTVRDGNRMTIRLKNSGKNNLDITLLYVDSSYGITCLYPFIGETNRLAAGEQTQVVLDVNADTTGLESLVAIVVRGERQPVDFSLLEQPSLETAKTRGANDSALATPLGKLLSSGVFGAGSTRGVVRRQTQDYGANVISWRISK